MEFDGEETPPNAIGWLGFTRWGSQFRISQSSITRVSVIICTIAL